MEKEDSYAKKEKELKYIFYYHHYLGYYYGFNITYIVSLNNHDCKVGNLEKVLLKLMMLFQFKEDNNEPTKKNGLFG